MRGKPRTKIKITIRRGSRKEPLNIVIIRDIIEIKAVSSRSEGQIGYLRLTTFNERATENLSKAIRKLQRETRNGPQGYILDLRNNPGGLLDQAVSVADLFLRRGEIVSIRGRADKGGQSGDRYNARGGDITNDKPIIVLINGRLGQRFGNCRRCAARPAPRDHFRHFVFRQRICPDGATSRSRQWRFAPDDRALLLRRRGAPFRRMASCRTSSSGKSSTKKTKIA